MTDADHYRPLARRIEYALSQLGTPISADDADALAATIERDGITELYLTAIDASIASRRTRQRHQEGRRHAS